MLTVGLVAALSGLGSFALAGLAWRKGLHLPARPPERINPDPGDGAPRLAGTFLTLGMAAGLLLLPGEVIDGWRLALTLPLVLMFLVGFVDDVRPLSCYAKLFFQLIPACLVAAFGLVPTRIGVAGLGQLELGTWAAPVAVLWIVAVTNAFNLIDGVDGLATGLGMVAAAGVAALAALVGSTPAAAVGLVLIACLFGVLPYTGNPARFYLGDSGSHVIGFSLACLTLLVSQRTGSFPFLPAMLVMAVPLLDLLFAVIRRTAHGVHPFHRDQAHLHHRLMRVGVSARQVCWVLWAANGGSAAMGLWLFTGARL